MRTTWNWLVSDWNWPGAALYTSVFLILPAVVIGIDLDLRLGLILLQMPLYMLHQWEEHAGDRFRAFVNHQLLKGREGLTRGATFWINSLGVWLLIVLVFLAAWLIDPGFGLVAGYLSLFNGLIHVAQGIGLQRYNPGLITSILLLIPFGLWCVLACSEAGGLTGHVLGAGLIVLLHAAIVVHIVFRLSMLQSSETS